MAIEEKFKKADLVQLKSGGPPMTVETYPADGVVRCVWFDKNKKYSDAFDQDLLVKFEMKPLYM